MAGNLKTISVQAIIAELQKLEPTTEFDFEDVFYNNGDGFICRLNLVITVHRVITETEDAEIEIG